MISFEEKIFATERNKSQIYLATVSCSRFFRHTIQQTPDSFGVVPVYGILCLSSGSFQPGEISVYSCEFS